MAREQLQPALTAAGNATMFGAGASLSYHLKPIPLHLGDAGGCRALSLLTQQQAAEPQRRIPPYTFVSGDSVAFTRCLLS